jgi:hypothetical protein
MGIDHGGFDVRVAEILLDLPDVHTAEEEMRGERVAQRILTLPMNRPPRSFTIVTIPSTANP